MLKDVSPLFRCCHQKLQPFADLGLPRELAEHGWSQRDFESGIRFRRFHRRSRANLITSNAKLRTMRFWTESLKGYSGRELTPMQLSAASALNRFNSLTRVSHNLLRQNQF